MRDNDDEFIGYHQSSVLSRIISSHIELKLEDNQTNVYIDGDYVKTCMDLKIIIPNKNIKQFDHINSIDDLSELISDSDLNNESIIISPEEEFWGHCSNLQAWVENDYDTRILHSNIAFPLLKKLTNVGDHLARNVFKEEIAKRFSSGQKTVILFLLEDDYLNYLDEFEKTVLFESIKINFSKFSISEFNQFVYLSENIFLSLGNDARSLFLMNNLNDITHFITVQISKPKFDSSKLHSLYRLLNKLMSHFIRFEKLFFDFEIANYKIKKYFSTDAVVEIRDDSTIYIQYEGQIFFTETNLSYDFDRYGIFLDLKNALFGNENIIFSNAQVNNFNSLTVEAIVCNKNAEEFYSENFSNVSDWIEYKNSAIKILTDLDQIDLEFIAKIHIINVILWNLICRCPKQTEMRIIKQVNFFFEITKFYDMHDCDVKIENYHIHPRELEYIPQNLVLIVKNRNDQFYRRYEDREFYNIIKSVFFRNENLSVENVFWRKNQQIFEISIKFDSKKNE